MDSQTSVTMSLQEYRSMKDGLSVGGVALVAIASFAVGVVVGVATLDEPKRPQPTHAPTSSVVVVDRR